ncbi:MAG: hypothetical protein HY270_14270 [Deltaproteobacteria bacterium]|nr:hypothetical protein [Deltaproteobacteria bacterium]
MCRLSSPECRCRTAATIASTIGAKLKFAQTPLEALKRWLGSIAWQRLHSVGIWIVWAIFFLCLVDSVSRKTTNHPLLAYHAFIAVLLFGLGLRIVAARKTSVPRARGPRGPSSRPLPGRITSN